MQKIIVDTNVLVSALIQKSYPFLILDELMVNTKINLCLSDALQQEYYEVLHRKKFFKYHEFLQNAEKLLADIEEMSIKYNPKIKLKILTDLDDNKLLELAHECKADYLITGNTNDFTMKSYEQTKIVTPKEYWERFRI